MTRSEFLALVKRHGIDPRAFSLGEVASEAYVLVQDGGGWCVFYSERGLETRKVNFATENEALTYLLALLGSDPSAGGQ